MLDGKLLGGFYGEIREDDLTDVAPLSMYKDEYV